MEWAPCVHAELKGGMGGGAGPDGAKKRAKAVAGFLTRRSDELGQLEASSRRALLLMFKQVQAAQESLLTREEKKARAAALD